MNIDTFRSQFHSEQTLLGDLRATAPGLANVVGSAEISSAGEAVFEVQFPVKFTSMPGFSYGFSSQPGGGYTPGFMPTSSAYVARWLTVERLPFSVWYTGAVIHTVIEGVPGQKMVLNYSLTGTALTGMDGA